MKLVSGEPGPFLAASFLFAPIIGLTVCGGDGGFNPEPAHTVPLSPQPARLARQVFDPTNVEWSSRCVPCLITIGVQTTDV